MLPFNWVVMFLLNKGAKTLCHTDNHAAAPRKAISSQRRHGGGWMMVVGLL